MIKCIKNQKEVILMPREKELFRENLSRINEIFGDAELIPIQAVGKFLGCYYRTIQNQKGFPIKKVGNRVYVTKTALAKWLSE